MKIEKNGKIIHFTKRKCRSGTVYDLRMRIRAEHANMARTTREERIRMVHELYCHTNMVQAKRAASKAGINIEDVDDQIDCLECKISKAKQKSMSKLDTNRSKTPGERLCLDISSVKTKTWKRFWVLVEDQSTSMKWSYFVKHKNDQVEPVIGLIKEINELNRRKVKFI